jgi:hypothetical protein
MWRRAVLVAVLAFPLAACVGVSGSKGNDTGGIIPWSPENELAALDIGQANCGTYRKFALITTVHRQYGDYIVYECRSNPVRQPRRAN